MIHEDLYRNFVDDCYENGKDLTEEMKKEFKKILNDYATKTIMDTPQGHENALNTSAEKIMKLVYETRYEW